MHRRPLNFSKQMFKRARRWAIAQYCFAGVIMQKFLDVHPHGVDAPKGESDGEIEETDAGVQGVAGEEAGVQSNEDEECDVATTNSNIYFPKATSVIWPSGNRYSNIPISEYWLLHYIK